MTLAGKKNHYNVKFLKGYGFSIKVKDSKIHYQMPLRHTVIVASVPIVEVIITIGHMIEKIPVQKMA
jgi:hypothetical protein